MGASTKTTTPQSLSSYWVSILMQVRITPLKDGATIRVESVEKPEAFTISHTMGCLLTAQEKFEFKKTLALEQQAS